MQQVLQKKILIFFCLLRVLMVLHRGLGLRRNAEKMYELLFFLKWRQLFSYDVWNFSKIFAVKRWGNLEILWQKNW